MAFRFERVAELRFCSSLPVLGRAPRRMTGSSFPSRNETALLLRLLRRNAGRSPLTLDLDVWRLDDNTSAARKKMTDSNSGKITIWVAVIGLVGTLGAAIVANYDDIFGSSSKTIDPPVTVEEPIAQASTIQGWTVFAGYHEGKIGHRYLAFSGNRPRVGTMYRPTGQGMYIYPEHLMVDGQAWIAELTEHDRVIVLDVEDWVAGNGATLLIGKVKTVD